jgi:hypothetical protein
VKAAQLSGKTLDGRGMAARIERRLARPRRLLAKALRTGDEQELWHAEFEIESAALGYKRMPEAVFALLVRTLADPSAHRHPGLWHILNNFHSDWYKLSAKQKRRLLVSLEDNYPKFGHWMAWFRTSSLLGEDFCNADALEALRRMMTVRPAKARSFVPHALEHIVTDSEDRKLSDDAFKLLTQMVRDRAAVVRREADLSFARIEARGRRSAV